VYSHAATIRRETAEIMTRNTPRSPGSPTGRSTGNQAGHLVILLPPSEGKAIGGDGPGWDPADGVFGASLADARRQVVRALTRAKGGDEKLLGVGGQHLTRAQSANRSLLGAPTRAAGERYTGVVWDHLDLATLSPAARARASAAIVVVSGLLGAVAVDDPTPDYRLKMGASLTPLGKVSTWWREQLSLVLNDHLADRYVVDLLPQEHRAAWVPSPERYAGFARVTFVEKSGGTKGAVVGHDAKAAKGLLARHLLTARSKPATALSSWTHDRFALVVEG
jgi:uncharacterized protein